MSGDVQEAKRRLPLPTLMNLIGLGKHLKKSALCPFHEDTRNSFSVWQSERGWFFKCHAGCGEGDEINLLELHKRISRADATRLYLEMAGANGDAPHIARTNDRRKAAAFNWGACAEAFSETHLKRLAEWRGYSSWLLFAQRKYDEAAQAYHQAAIWWRAGLRFDQAHEDDTACSRAEHELAWEDFPAVKQH